MPAIPLEFVFFALTLLGVAVFHRHTLTVALGGHHTKTGAVDQRVEQGRTTARALQQSRQDRFRIGGIGG